MYNALDAVLYILSSIVLYNGMVVVTTILLYNGSINYGL